MTDVLAPDTPRSRGPLRSRNFRLLVTGTTTSSLGNAITPVALAFAVLDLGGSAGQLGLVVAAFALAEVVTVLFGGVLGDRLPRQLMMEGSAAASAVTQALMATLLVGGWATIPLLGVIGAVNGCLSALSGPSSQAMTRLTVPPADLGTAVALRRLMQTSASVVGFSAGGFLVAAVGPGWAIAVDATTYSLAALCYALLRVPHTRPETQGASLLADLGDGLREVLRHAWLWILIGQALLYHLFYGGVQGVLGPIVVGDGIGRSAWGLALGMLMAGFVVGGLVCLRWRPTHGLFVGTALLSLTAAFPLAMALSDQLWPVLLGRSCTASASRSSASTGTSPSSRTSRRTGSRGSTRSTIVGSFVARPLGLALTAPVAEAVGFQRWLVVVGVIMGGSPSWPCSCPTCAACAAPADGRRCGRSWRRSQSGLMDAPTPRFVDDRLAHWAAETPDAEAMTYGRRTWSWAEWDDRVRRAAGGLHALGVGRGDVWPSWTRTIRLRRDQPGRRVPRRRQRDHQLAARRRGGRLRGQRQRRQGPGRRHRAGAAAGEDPRPAARRGEGHRGDPDGAEGDE
ncbi:MFS transporter [Nocardioides ungokensis]|uniref:MFS transporter n=1 Tax=Nocardioides ungokensis TaxID=1643322 RepID=UPI001FE7B57D|nr:MFS transporter [Nocardioides ungokensis]